MVSTTRSRNKSASEQNAGAAPGSNAVLDEVNSQQGNDVPAGSRTPKLRVVKEVGSPALRTPLLPQKQQHAGSTPQAGRSTPRPSHTPEMDEALHKLRVTHASRQPFPSENAQTAPDDGSEGSAAAYDSEQEGGNGDDSQPQHCSTDTSSSSKLLRIIGILLVISAAILVPVFLHDACDSSTPMLQRLSFLQTKLSTLGVCNHPLSRTIFTYTKDLRSGISKQISSAKNLLQVWKLYNTLQQQLENTRSASVQLWQQHNPRSFFASFPSSANLSKLVSQAWNSIQMWCNSSYVSLTAHLQNAFASAYSYWAELLQKLVSLTSGNKDLALGSSAALKPCFTSLLSLQAFRALLAEGKHWSENATDFWSNVVHQTSRTKAKGTGLILTCQHAVECDSVATALAESVANKTCLIEVHSSSYSSKSSAGEFQQLLAKFLTRCPHGIVVIRYVHMLSTDSLSVLNNVLSESGNLQQSGVSVDTHLALYLIIFETQTPTGGDDSVYTRDVKSHLVYAIESSQPEGSVDQTGRALLEAFRRRIDHIAPAKQVPNAGLPPAATTESE